MGKLHEPRPLNAYATVDEVKDYHKRIIAWYDSHLKGDLKKKADEQKSDTPLQ